MPMTAHNPIVRLVGSVVLAAGLTLVAPGAPAPAGVLPTCNGEAPTILGTEESETIVGTAGPDVIVGLGGADTIDGRGGADVICADEDFEPGTDGGSILGGRGRDRLIGDSGEDDLFGGGGGDKIIAGAGNDVLEGQADDDELSGGDGIDVLLGAGGDDTLAAGDGADNLDGDVGADRLLGGGGNDQANGGPGTDQLEGGSGDDRLQGGDDRDDLEGDGGSDRLNGGAARDTCDGGGQDGDSFVSCERDGDEEPPPPPPSDNVVRLTDGCRPRPSILEVSVGTTVTFRNRQDNEVTLSFDGRGDVRIAANGALNIRFGIRGTFDYRCRPGTGRGRIVSQ